MPLFIRADRVSQVANDVFMIELPYRSLTDRQREVLQELFPNLSDAAHTLLERETLLSCLLSEEHGEELLSRGVVAVPVENVSKKGKPSKQPAKLSSPDLYPDDTMQHSHP